MTVEGCAKSQPIPFRLAVDLGPGVSAVLLQMIHIHDD